MEEAGRAAASSSGSRPTSVPADFHLATIEERRPANAPLGGQGAEDEAATLLGGHHGKEQLGLSVFGFFKLVSRGRGTTGSEGWRKREKGGGRRGKSGLSGPASARYLRPFGGDAAADPNSIECAVSRKLKDGNRKWKAFT